MDDGRRGDLVRLIRGAGLEPNPDPLREDERDTIERARRLLELAPRFTRTAALMTVRDAVYTLRRLLADDEGGS